MLPDLDRIYILTHSLLTLGGDLILCLAVLRELECTLQPHGITEFLLGNQRLLLVLARLVRFCCPFLSASVTFAVH